MFFSLHLMPNLGTLRTRDARLLKSFIGVDLLSAKQLACCLLALLELLLLRFHVRILAGIQVAEAREKKNGCQIPECASHLASPAGSLYASLVGEMK
jgi:hypothetical protein